jgi:hypothetical protein
MAFFSFGKKDKNPPQSAEPVAKTPPGSPPKIQTPPSDAEASAVTIPAPPSIALPSVKPPQSSGLMPAVGPGRNTITTQPMGMPPRPVSPPASPLPPLPPEGQKNRSTQRLVATTNAAGKMTSTRPLGITAGGGDVINLPAGMILRCLPQEMLAAPLAEFEASGAAATEVGLPINAILSQLPSGKVELPIGDVIARFPAGFLRPAEELAGQLQSVINLPLMDVVMRIPPDLLAVRPDQKDVDASVKRMADPFIEDANAHVEPPAPVVQTGEARIVEEGQQEPGSEEFVPQQVAPPSPTAGRSFVPPPRNASMPLLQQTASLSGRPFARTTPMPDRVPSPAEEVPMPPGPRQLSASQILGVPRPSMSSPVLSPHIAGATASGPLELRAPGASGITSPSTVPQIPPVTATTVMPASARPLAAAPAASAPPDANADELQRLAALAMAETGDAPVGLEEETALAAEPQEQEPPVSAEKLQPGLAATPGVQAPQPVRELAQTAALAPAPVEPAVRPASQAEPIRLPSVSEPIRPPVPLPEPSAPAGVSKSIRPSGPQMGMTRATTRMTTKELPVPEPEPLEPEAAGAAPAATAINLNNCTADDLLPIPGITRELAANIVQHRDKIGEFHKLEELLDVPGMTRAAYSNLTGETPSSGVHPSVNELLGFPPEQELSLKDVTDRISCWPDVTGCLLSQKNGLHLVGTAPDFLDKAAIVAFAPRLFEDMNKSFGEITGRESDELIIPTSGTSFHLLREKDLYLIILSRLPQMPERHLKIARFVLAGLSSRPS